MSRGLRNGNYSTVESTVTEKMNFSIDRTLSKNAINLQDALSVT